MQLAVQSKISSEGAGGADRLFSTLANGNGFTSPFAELDYSAVSYDHCSIVTVCACSSGCVLQVTKEDVAAAAQAVLKSTPGYAVYGTTYQVPFLGGITKMMA